MPGDWATFKIINVGVVIAPRGPAFSLIQEFFRSLFSP
jgi:hypothetical protein